ncbi:MAG: endonuclease [Brumimicrobium sp.]
MKTFITLILFFPIFLFACESGEVLSKDTLSNSPIKTLKTYENRPFMFYNVENLFDTINDPNTLDDEFLPESSKKWTSKRYFDKLEKLATVLTYPSDNNPLFFGLAEVENKNVVQDLIKTGRLATSNYSIIHYDSPDIRGIDVALVYDFERFHVLYQESIDLSITEEPDYKTRDILYVKGLLKDGLNIHVFVNHWSSRRGGVEASEYKRINAANALTRKTDSIRNVDANANIIIMGDFNDHPNNKSIKETLGAGSKEDKKDFVNLMLPLKKEGLGTYNFRGDWGMLDQFIVSFNMIDENNALQIKNGTAMIVNDDQFMHIFESGEKTPNKTYGGPNYYGGYSDHLAIYGFLIGK